MERTEKKEYHDGERAYSDEYCVSARAIAACGGWHIAVGSATEGNPLASAQQSIARLVTRPGGMVRWNVVVDVPFLGTFQASRVALDDVRTLIRLIPHLSMK